MNTAQPQIVSLLKPECSLVVCFTALGSVTVSRRMLQPDGRYAATVLGDLPQITTDLGFEFGVDAPWSALMVETDSIWNVPWDEERIFTLGCEPFVVGNGPIGAPGNFDPTLHTRRIHTGRFWCDAEGNYKVTVVGLHSRTESDIPPGVPHKYFSLWLPTDATGYVKFTGWPGAEGVKEFRSVAAPMSAVHEAMAMN